MSHCGQRLEGDEPYLLSCSLILPNACGWERQGDSGLIQREEEEAPSLPVHSLSPFDVLPVRCSHPISPMLDLSVDFLTYTPNIGSKQPICFVLCANLLSAIYSESEGKALDPCSDSVSLY